MSEPETIVISNFGGRLTRILNGDLNSGFAKFDTSFGYDPFTKPMNLTWLPQPQSVTGIGNTNVVVTGKTIAGDTTSTSPATFTYVVDVARKVYKIERSFAPGVNSVVGQQSIIGGSASQQWGGAITPFGLPLKLFVSGQGHIQTVGSLIGFSEFRLNGATSVIGNSSFLAGNYHPMIPFAGNLIFGNGPSIGAIDATNTVVSSVFTISHFWGNQYSELFPGLGSNQNVRDLDVAQDGNYLLMSGSELLNPRKAFPNIDHLEGQPVGGNVFGWNGVDETVTTAFNIPFGGPSAMQIYMQQNMYFINDGFGMAISDGARKLATVPNSRSPFPDAVDVNGNFIVWMTSENFGEGSDNTRVGSLYYFGSLDEENPVGLYRLLRYESPLAGGFVYDIPYHELVQNAGWGMFFDLSSVYQVSLPTHYFAPFNVSAAVQSPSTVGSGGLFAFYASSKAFDIDPDSNLPYISAPPQEGVYETQTQLFSKRIHVEQIRVYTENTVSGNGFQLDIIGQDGDPIENGTFTYSFVAGDDLTKLQGSLQRINFNPTADAGYGFAIRITNTGSKNMTFKKIECDVSQEGR